MSAVTGKQIVALNRLFTDGEGVSAQRLQMLLDSGLIADLRDADVDAINRAEFRRVCGIEPLDGNVPVGNSISDNFIITPAPLDPTKFLGRGWNFIPDESDKRSAVLTEVDFRQVDIVDCLNPNEDGITGDERIKRIHAKKRILYGATVFMGVLLDYEAKKKSSVLETLYRTRKLTYMNFLGDRLSDPRGKRRAESDARDDR
jgi:hypothetical protein